MMVVVFYVVYLTVAFLIYTSLLSAFGQIWGIVAFLGVVAVVYLWLEFT